MRGRALTPWLAMALAGAALAIPGSAGADVILHEYLPPDAADDLRLGATTRDGAMPAAIETQTGPVSSPELQGPGEGKGTVYGATQSPPGSGDAYHADSDTTRPESVPYDDPFTPGIAPYKREFAYDTVTDGLDLVVRDPSESPLFVGGTARLEDDQFYADLQVDFSEGQHVRIPTVGPGTRLLAARSVPETHLEFFHDSAENWFVKGDREGRVRLVLHLAVDRAVFGSSFAEIDWNRLWRFLPPLSEIAKREGVRIARQIGVVDGTGPAEALGILVRYFRGFSPSKDRPRSTGIELYRELAISKKGVCRHRSYAFMVTALALGIPTRFVHNEAHAWVEVFDGTRWHRVDLGGAAERLDAPDVTRIAYVPPRDPFEWPAGSESGQTMADWSRARAGKAPAAQAAAAPPVTTTTSAAETAPNDSRPRSTVTLTVGAADTRRGARVELSGRIDTSGTSCAEARVDLFLEPKAGFAEERIPLGTLVTNADGRYEGRVVVPYVVPPGDYDVRATTPGNLTCGPGVSP